MLKMSMDQFWGRQTFCVITGASRGIGRCFAIEFARKFGLGSKLLLIARSKDGLRETEALVLAANPQISVQIHSADLSKPDADDYKTILQGEESTFELALLVNNAGSIGKADQLAKDMGDPDEWNRYLSLNLYHVTSLTAEFLRKFSSGRRCIVNVTSLFAIKPTKSMGYYCVGKAAREMYFRVLAEENPDLDILNYSPGPVDTDMVTALIDSVQDEEIKGSFVSMKEDRHLVTVEQTTHKLIQVLSSHKYTSGGRFDYYDPL